MTREDLLATASLARLGMTEDEAAAALPAFERMLGYFAALEAADQDEDAFGARVADLEPASLAVRAAARLRSDVIENSNNVNNANRLNLNDLNNLAAELMHRAPESENGFFVLPNVL